MNKIIAIIGILSTLILTGCDPNIVYYDKYLNKTILANFNEDDNVKIIRFNVVESNDYVTVTINLKKNK